MKFLAAILVEPGSPLVVDTIQVNQLLPSQVLVKIHKSGICRSQLNEIDGLRGKDKYLPHLLGHEAVGTVVDVGSSESQFSAGDTVILSWIKGSGIQGPLPDLSWNFKKLNAGHVTTFSEYSVVSESRLFKSDQVLEHPLGPMFGCAIPTGYSISLTYPNISQCNFIAIVGLGGVGMFALQGLLSNTSASVICIDKDFSRLSLASSLGAHYVCNSTYDSPLDFISKITDGKLCDLVVECTGIADVTSSCLSLINNSGAVKFVSHPPEGQMLKINPFDLILGKRIEGSWAGGSIPSIHFPRILDDISFESPITRQFPFSEYTLDNINVAVSDLRKGKALRPLLIF